MKKILSTLLLAIALPCVALANTNSTTSKEANTNKSQALFVLLSKEASMQPTNQSDIYTLSLKGVGAHVIYFSDRPERSSGKMDTKKFIKQWKDGAFKEVPPNAMIETVKMDAKTKQLQNNESSYAVTLNDPVSSADYKNVTFKVKALSGGASLKGLDNGKYVAIFIDGICISCMGG